MDIKDQLIRHEGLRLKVYLDSEGIETIGVGRNLRDVGITEQEASFLLSNDIKRTIDDCKTFHWFNDLDDVRKRVIIDMIFNLGLVRFSGFYKTIKCIADHRFEEAAVEMLDSKWAVQVGIRATRLSYMMETGKDK